jgi:uncharacterized protein with FMN-binding domain
MPEYFKVVEERGWTRDLKIRSIKGGVIAIAGTGNLGQNAAKRFKALGAKKVIGFSRSGSSREFFDEVFRIDEFETVISSNSEEDQIDALVLCVPGTSDSEGLLSAERIAVLPEKAFVINVGRGTVIDQEALIEALNDGCIAGAALDVMYPEPLPADQPDVPEPQGNQIVSDDQTLQTGNGKEPAVKYADGRYSASTFGFGGQVVVDTVIENNIIKSISVISADGETPAFLQDAVKVIDDILANQNTDVDTVSGATYSSRAIIDSVKKALQEAEQAAGTAPGQQENSIDG